MSVMKNGRLFTISMVLAAVIIAALVSGYASAHPDGLESVALTSGFAGDARDSLTAGWPLADYAVAGIDNARVSGGLAGLAGCALTFALVWGVTNYRARATRN